MDQNRQVSGDHARGHRRGKIDYPGALQTGPMGISCRINAEGEIVGGDPGTDRKIHGFLFDASGFSSIDFPNTNLTSPRAINPRGDIVGFYREVPPSGGFIDNGFLISR
jgi:hypothetical protein